MLSDVNIERMKGSFWELSEFGKTPGGGITRVAFGRQYFLARDWLRERMEDVGLDTQVDSAGNLFGRLGQGDEVVMVGSHLDTVPNGGRFDGTLGLLAGLECVQSIQEEYEQPGMPIEIAAFNDEEGSFYSLLGSRAVTGALDEKALEEASNTNNVHLSEAMKRCGLNVSEIWSAKRVAPRIRAYLELHIEQGPRLDSLGIPIGIVKSIVGLVNYSATFMGESDHAGTTPMSTRKDAFLGAAEFALKSMKWVRGSCAGSTLNMGDIRVLPGASNIVPGEARLALEFRDASFKVLKKLGEGLVDIGQTVAQSRGLEFSFVHISTDIPVCLSPRVQTVLEEGAAELGYEYLLMNSGAGHDAQVIALHTDAGMIFVPSIRGKSHCPEENTRWEDIEKGTNLLLTSLLKLANE